jgi:Ser/Thr protein kinase RdoA (MazF antagonist)
MKLFAELTHRGQSGRLKELARKAIGYYPLDIVDISLLCYHNNATFRLKDRKGEQYVLRVNRPMFHGASEILSETHWSTALSRDTDLQTPQAILSNTGSPVVSVEVEGVPQQRDTVIFRWIPGRFTNRLTPAYVHRAGKALATMHVHGKQWRPPDGFTRKTWSSDLLWKGEPATDKMGIRQILSPADLRIHTEVGDLCQQAFRALGNTNEAYGLIHADFHCGNFMSIKGGFAAIDFDDCGYGHFIYDLSVLLGSLLNRPTYPALREALLSGYRSLHPFPEEHERFFARMIALRWIFLSVWRAGVYEPRELHADAEAFARSRIEAILARSLHKEQTRV